MESTEVEVIELKRQTKQLELNQIKLISFFEKISGQIANALEVIKKGTDENQKWSKEFHRLLLNEYAQYPQNKIYGLVYTNMIDHTGRRLMLVSAKTFEQAQTTSETIFLKEGENPKDWVIEGYQSLNVPMTEEDVADKIDKKMFIPEKPLGVFVNDLMLVRDRFTKPSERKMLSTIIKRIEKVDLKENIKGRIK